MLLSTKEVISNVRKTGGQGRKVTKVTRLKMERSQKAFEKMDSEDHVGNGHLRLWWCLAHYTKLHLCSVSSFLEISGLDGREATNSWTLQLVHHQRGSDIRPGNTYACLTSRTPGTLWFPVRPPHWRTPAKTDKLDLLRILDIWNKPPTFSTKNPAISWSAFGSDWWLAYTWRIYALWSHREGGDNNISGNAVIYNTP